MIGKLRRQCCRAGVALALMLFVCLSTFSLSRPGEAATIPSSIRVGLNTSAAFYDIKAVQGSYRLVDKASGRVLVSSLRGEETYRVQLKLGSSDLQLFCSTGGGGWKEKGTYKGPLVLEESPSVSRGGFASPALVELDGSKYRGSIEIRLNREGSGLTSINQLPLEDYLCGVLPREVSDRWPLEALKAQAIAARTYALRNLSRHAGEGFNLCSGTNCQAYGGYSWERSNCTRAVQETRGMVLLDDRGELACTLYHSNSGGYLEDNLNVNGTEVYYLKAKPDPYSLGNGLADWALQVVAEGRDAAGRPGLRDSLLASGSSIRRIESLELVKYPSGRVEKVMITDERGNTIEKSGSQFATLFNPGFRAVGADQFMSRMFDLTTDATVCLQNARGEMITRHGGARQLAVIGGNGRVGRPGGNENAVQVQGAERRGSINFFPQKISVQGHGWGHGVGMSQWGAYGMASQGFKCSQILDFYYPGTKLVTLK